MSLNITSPLTTDTGIELATSYGRVSVADSYAGNKLQGYVDIFASEAAYNAGARPIKLNEFIQGGDRPYDRNIESTDILLLAHDLLVSILADQSVTATISL